MQILQSLSYLQQSWKPIFVGLAVQTGATILPQKGKCKTAYMHKHISSRNPGEAIYTHTHLTEPHPLLLDLLLDINSKRVHGFVCFVFQGGAMAGHVACLSSMTQGKVKADCIYAEMALCILICCVLFVSFFTLFKTSLPL